MPGIRLPLERLGGVPQCPVPGVPPRGDNIPASQPAGQDFRKSSREKKEENPEKDGDEDEKRLREDARRSRKSRRKSEGEGKDDAA